MGSVHRGGSCMVGGMRGRGRAWQILRDTVNERAVRIQLECILVNCITFVFVQQKDAMELGGVVAPEQAVSHVPGPDQGHQEAA